MSSDGLGALRLLTAKLKSLLPLVLARTHWPRAREDPAYVVPVGALLLLVAVGVLLYVWLLRTGSRPGLRPK